MAKVINILSISKTCRGMCGSFYVKTVEFIKIWVAKINMVRWKCICTKEIGSMLLRVQKASALQMYFL